MQSPQFKQIFSTNLRYYRKKNQLTQMVLAAKADTDHRYIQKLEAGEQVPSVLIAYRLAAALGITVDDLCREQKLSRNQ